MQAFNYKKKTGVHPSWYIKDVKYCSIDINKYFARANLELRIWDFATNKLFYLLTYDFKITENRLASIMANKSLHFNETSSWVTFLAQNLFSPQSEKRQNVKYSMTSDFLRVGSHLAYQLIKEARLNKDGKYSEDLKEALSL